VSFRVKLLTLAEGKEAASEKKAFHRRHIAGTGRVAVSVGMIEIGCPKADIR
jgi:hypothetical protein